MNELPDVPTLTRGLTAMLRTMETTATPISVIDRESNEWASTFPSEIVTCRDRNGRILRIFCKYATGASDDSCNHRGGVRYEAEVYRRLLRPLRASTPQFYGFYVDEATNVAWLSVEYVEEGVRLNRLDGLKALRGAVRWIAQFHTSTASRIRDDTCSFLTRYDAGYYLQWPRRTMQFVAHSDLTVEWLPALCRRYADSLAPLLEAPEAVVHGEFYPSNILVYDETIRPVDWESAAIAPGVIDLASLTEGWPADIVRACEREYVRTRWPHGPPGDVDRLLGLARVYFHFRWLGGWPDRIADDDARWRFEHLRRAGERLGLL